MLYKLRPTFQGNFIKKLYVLVLYTFNFFGGSCCGIVVSVERIGTRRLKFEVL